MKNLIIQSCKIANKSYLESTLKKIADENIKNQIISMFNSHMVQIAEFCIDNFINKTELTENFIRWLHKILFPSWYTESQKTIKWDWEVIYMIPWVYKTLKNFNYVLPKDVKNEMKNFINNYNLNINKVENKYDFMLYILIDFLRIHPFGNGNWRVISILVDLFFIKNKLPPLYFREIQSKNIDTCFLSIHNSIKKNNISPIKSFIRINTIYHQIL